MPDTSTIPPGPELDAAVAERFMGWHSPDRHSWWDESVTPRVLYATNPRFSTDPTACQLLKDELVRRGWMLETRHYANRIEATAYNLRGPMRTELYGDVAEEFVEETAPTETEAICRLCLAVAERSGT